MTKFFAKRSIEQRLLNKLEMMEGLLGFMQDRQHTNDFAFEDDLKIVETYMNVVHRWDISINSNIPINNTTMRTQFEVVKEVMTKELVREKE